jgi:hypothetical protein
MMYLFFLKLTLVILVMTNIVLAIGKSLSLRQVILVITLVVILSLLLAIMDLVLLQMIIEQLTKPLQQHV